jgi:hypothetical protein
VHGNIALLEVRLLLLRLLESLHRRCLHQDLLYIDRPQHDRITSSGTVYPWAAATRAFGTILPEPLLMQSTDQAVIFNYAVLFMLMSL